MMTPGLKQRLVAEFLGTAFLLAAVVGSGIMGEALAGGNVAIALLANSLATGALLAVLIATLGPISGAHFNPAVTAVLAARREVAMADAGAYLLAQLAGACVGVLVAHAMFDLPVFQLSHKARSGFSQIFSESVATFGLVLTILMTVRTRAQTVGMSVGLYIAAAYWFTASTSFANPAVTVARAFSDTFAGIRPVDVLPFVAAQLLGAFCAASVVSALVSGRQAPTHEAGTRPTVPAP